MSWICARCGRETEGGETGGGGEADPRCPACGESALLDGRYRLEETLGQGSSGITYRATRLEDGRTVCVKELNYRAMANFEMQELFHREARVLRQLDQPGIPEYIDDFAVESGKNLSLYLVQEFVDGPTLAAEMESRRYTEADILEVLKELAGIVAYLQDLRPPVIHRDIKPGNVMRAVSSEAAGEGRLMLVDFGSVKATTDGAVGGSTVVGTFGYMAPEQHWGEAGRGTDLYGLGVLGLVMLTRREPREFVDEDHRLAWQGKVDASEAMTDVLEALTRHRMEARPADAEEARRLIEGALRRLEAGDVPVDETGGEAGGADAEEQGRRGEIQLALDREPPEQTASEERRSRATSESSLGWLVMGLILFVGFFVGFLSLVQPSSDAGGELVVVSEPAEETRQRGYFRLDELKMCAGDSCEPFDALFKSELRFGMSLEAARTARPELAEAKKATGTMPSEDFVEVRRMRQAGVSPGPVLRAEMALGGRPAACSFEFFDEGALSRATCRSAKFRGCGRLESYTRSLLEKLTRRYGRPTSMSESPTSDGRTIIVSPLRSREASWSWEGDSAELTLEMDCTEIDGGAPGGKGTGKTVLANHVELTQTSAAHEDALEAMRRVYRQKERERQEAREQREREKRQKLQELSEDDPL